MGILGTLALSNPLVALAGAGLLCGGLWAGYEYWHHEVYTEGFDTGKQEVQAKWTAADLARSADDTRRTQALAKDFDDIKRKSDAQLNSIAAKYAAANRELLRTRTAARASDAALAQCKGTTGAQLSGPDAGFLNGEATRAERQRGLLAKCYDEVDSISKQFEKGASSNGASP